MENAENREKPGYGKPPRHTQFKPGQSGNPGGVSSERKRLLNESAEIAARIMHRQLTALEDMFHEHPEKEAIVALINADVHRLVKDAIDRVEGTARQSLDLSSTDGTMTPRPGVDLSKLSDQALAELIAARDASADPKD
jgi:hypothetical protein